MINSENMCNLNYLSEMMGGKKHLVKGMMDDFLVQISEELNSLNDAIIKTDYAAIKSLSHTMKTTISIVRVSILTPILQEIENLGSTASNIDKIKELNQNLNSICKRVIEEIEKEKINYA